MISHRLYTENGLTARGFEYYTARARKMSDSELAYAVADCQECIIIGCNPLRYTDEVSCYHQELSRRK